jgi:hypothetical protein
MVKSGADASGFLTSVNDLWGFKLNVEKRKRASAVLKAIDDEIIDRVSNFAKRQAVKEDCYKTASPYDIARCVVLKYNEKHCFDIPVPNQKEWARVIK